MIEELTNHDNTVAQVTQKETKYPPPRSWCGNAQTPQVSASPTHLVHGKTLRAPGPPKSFSGESTTVSTDQAATEPQTSESQESLPQGLDLQQVPLLEEEGPTEAKDTTQMRQATLDNFGSRTFRGRRLAAGPAFAADVHPFPCEQCGLSFKTKQALVAHARWNHGDKPAGPAGGGASSAGGGDGGGEAGADQPGAGEVAAEEPIEAAAVTADGDAVADRKGRLKGIRKDGQPKLTTGAGKRTRYDPLQVVKYIEAHRGAIALGLSPKQMDPDTGFFKAAGTPLPYHTLRHFVRNEAEYVRTATDMVNKRLKPKKAYYADCRAIRLLRAYLKLRVPRFRQGKRPCKSQRTACPPPGPAWDESGLLSY